MTKGTVYNEETFLNNIASKLNRPIRTEVTRDYRQHLPQLKVYEHMNQDDLLQEFKKSAQIIKTGVVETNVDSLSEILEKQVSSHGNGSIIIPEDPRFIEYGLSEFMKQEDVYEWDISRGKENINIAEKANIGIMFSDITLAESATVLIFNDKYKARTISLLPTTFIAIIPKSTLVPRFTQAAQEIEKRISDGTLISSYVNLISGPSNSADIELRLVVGVHGPIRVSYIVILDR